MLAASLNYRDWEILSGTYHSDFQFPLVPLSDACAEVVATGEGVSRYQVGDMVMTSFWQKWPAGKFDPKVLGSQLGGPLNGVLAEYACFDEEGLALVPPGLTALEAATLPCAAVTAYQALFVEGGLTLGDTVLVQGTGGVSTFALQLAVAAGARVIVTSSTDEKLDLATDLGAFAGVNYRRSPDWGQKVLEVTDGRGVDHVLEVGGPMTFAQSLVSLRPGGQINVIGYLGGSSGHTNPLDIFRKQATVRGIPVGPRSTLVSVASVVAQTGIRPLIHKIHHWREAAAALESLGRAEHVGKVVLRFDGP